MEKMGSVGRGEKREEQGVELFCEERGVLWEKVVAEESFFGF